MPRDHIGGFFELELPERRDGFLKAWGVPEDPRLLFGLARTALAALVEALEPQTVWVPAYICRSVPRQIPVGRRRFYSVGDRLDPDVPAFAQDLAPGDLVIGMNYFGRAPDEAFRALAEDRDDVWFVEDCAQTIDTGVPPWGDFRIFSPRKLLGVPDGGIIVPVRRGAPERLATIVEPDLEAVRPLILRYEDEADTYWGEWHEGHERWTDGQQATEAVPRRMSRLTRTILGLLDPDAVASARRRNFAVLRERLQSVSYLDELTDVLDPPAFVPFGFPVRFPPAQRDAVRTRLWTAGVYAFRHFADLTAPADTFPAEHALSAELITLPCDQRYSVTDMEFVAGVVESAMADLAIV